MFAIIESGGKQYRVSPGQVLRVEKMDADPGERLSLEKVLLLSKDGRTVTGTPYVEGAAVKASVVETSKAGKVLVFKMKPRKGFRRLRGHRQPYTSIRIEEIVYGG